jgi:hypothetical protein
MYSPQPFDLSATFVREIPIPVGSYAVIYYDGADDSVFLQKTREDDDPNRIELLHHSAASLNGGAWYLVNKVAQPGKRLKIDFGEPGTSISPGTSAEASASGGASESTLQDVCDALDNEPAIAHGRKTVPTVSAEAIGSQAIPDGKSVILQADDDNSVPVYVGGASVTADNGIRLEPGRALSVQVTNLGLLYCIAASGTNYIRWLVEAAS